MVYPQEPMIVLKAMWHCLKTSLRFQVGETLCRPRLRSDRIPSGWLPSLGMEVERSSELLKLPVRVDGAGPSLEVSASDAVAWRSSRPEFAIDTKSWGWSTIRCRLGPLLKKGLKRNSGVQTTGVVETHLGSIFGVLVDLVRTILSTSH